MRAPGFPFWITIVAAILAACGPFGGPVGLPALDIPLDDPGYYARGLGLSVALVVAIWLRSAAAYAAGFAGCAIREAGDLFALWTVGDIYPQAFLATAIFLVLELICLNQTWRVARARKSR